MDRGVSTWLSHIETEAGARVKTTMRLRYLSALALVALVVVPSLFSLAFGAAIALPVGAATVAVLFLICAAVVIGLHQSEAQGDDAAVVTGAIASDLIPGAILVLSDNGVIEHAAGRDLGLFPKQLRQSEGRIFAELLHVSDRLSMLQAFDSLRQGTRDVVAEVRFEHQSAEASAQFMHARLDMTAERDGNGRLIRVYAHMSDMSERQELINEIAARTADAASSNEAKSRFLAAVSHEMRTPLNAVLGFADILAGEYFGKLENDRQREYVGLIRQSGAHLLAVVNSMLDMSKLESGRYELMLAPFDIAQSINACEAMLKLTARDKGVMLTSRIGRGLDEVTGDQRAIQQVLINLTSNAIKFTELGGVVTVDATKSGKDLVLTVSDTGIGIAEDMVEKLGTPFTQVQSELNRCYEGTGLGLALVKGFVALHGGKVEISSRLGEGTVVTVTMPLDGSGAEALAASALRGECVEFPPRLKAQAPAVRRVIEEDVNNGPAKAKYA